MGASKLPEEATVRLARIRDASGRPYSKPFQEVEAEIEARRYGLAETGERRSIRVVLTDDKGHATAGGRLDSQRNPPRRVQAGHGAKATGPIHLKDAGGVLR